MNAGQSEKEFILPVRCSFAVAVPIGKLGKCDFTRFGFKVRFGWITYCSAPLSSPKHRSRFSVALFDVYHSIVYKCVLNRFTNRLFCQTTGLHVMEVLRTRCHLFIFYYDIDVDVKLRCDSKPTLSVTGFFGTCLICWSYERGTSKYDMIWMSHLNGVES